MKFISLGAIAFALLLSSCSSALTTEEYLQRAASHMEKKEWKSAIIEYKNGIQQSPKNAQARFLLGQAYLHTHSSDAAIKELTKSIDFGVDKNLVLAKLAEAYAQANKVDLIIEKIHVNPQMSKVDQLAILTLRARAFILKNEKLKAYAELEKAKTVDDQSTGVRLMWAMYEARYGSVENQLVWLQPLLDSNVADAWSQVGNIERIKKDFDKAESAFTKAINSRKRVEQDYLSRALVRISLKEYELAKDDIKALKKVGFRSATILHTEGIIAFYQKDLDLAQSKLDEVLAKYKNYAPSLFVLGLTHYQKGNYESAINVLDQYLNSQPGNFQARFILATALLQSQKLSQAIDELERLYQQDSSNAQVSSMLGGAYVRNGQLNKGIHLFEKSVTKNPDQAAAQLQLGSALVRSKKTRQKGQEALMKALNLDPKLLQANLTLYLSYMQNKSFDKAANVAQKMMEENPDNSLSYNLLGHTYLAKGEKSKAMAFFKSTLKKFPSDPLISSSIARVEFKDNNPDAAKEAFLNVLVKYPNNLKTLVSLAVLEAKLGNDNKKMDYLNQAIESNPTVLSPKIILATEYLKQKEYKKASNVLKGISENDKAKPEILLFNAKVKMGLKEYDYALVLLKKLTTKKPKSFVLYFLLGQNYAYLKQQDNMKEAFEKVLIIKPDHFGAALILARLSLLEKNKSEFEKRINVLMKVYPNNADVKFLYAKLATSDKEYQTAITTLESLLKNAPHPLVVFDLAKNKWSSGDKDGAIVGIELWIDSHPTDKKALMLLAQFYMDVARFDDANLIYEKVDKLLPDNAIVLNNMAWLYRESNVIEGIKLARRALKLEPKSAFIQDTLAMLLLGNDNIDEALIYAKKAAKGQPDFVEIQLNYAAVLIANGQKAQAKRVLNIIDTKVKSFDQREQIRSMLRAL